LAHVPTITAAHMLVYDHTLLSGEHMIFAECGIKFSSLSNLQRSCAHHSTKYGCMPIRVLL